MAEHNILDDASSVGSGAPFSSKSQLPPSGHQPSRSRLAGSSSASRWAWVPLAGLVAAALALGGPVLAAESTAIRAGSELDFRPYGFTDKDGQPTGFGPELLRSVADKMGLQLQRTVGPWNEVWNDLVAGKLDVLPVVARTPGREPLVDFSLPHTETFDAFFVRSGQPVIANLAAASGKEIVVLREDAAHHQLVERNFAGKIIAVGSIPEGLRLVAAGKHDAFLCSKVIGMLELKEARIAGVAAGPPIPDYKRTFCFGVRKGQAELVEKLNQGLLIVKSDGTYDRLYRQWLNTYEPRYPYLAWFRGAAAVAGGLAVAALVLQGLVRRRTRQLRELNATLEARVTERTATLRESNERLNLVLEASSVGTFEIDLTTGDGQWNAVEFELLGLQPGAARACPETFFKYVHAGDVDALRGHWEEALQSGKMDAEFRIVRADGEERWLVGRGRFAFEDNVAGTRGRALKFLGINFDITERKRAEENLREQQRLHKSVTDNATLALFIMDDRQHCVFMNPAAVQLTGYTLEETQGRPLHDVVHHTRPDGRPFPLSECAIDRAFPENDREQGEEIFVHKNGHFYPVAFTASPLRNASGEPVGTIIEVQDITERKQAEAALRESEKNYRTLFTSMDQGFCVIEMLFDPQGKPNDWRFVEVNPAFERHNGLVQATGKRIRELTPGIESKWFEIYGKVALTGQAIRFEESSEALNRWFDLYAFPVGQPDEHKVAVLFTDITARKRAEAELAKYREDLERLVAERTAKLQELVGELEHFSYTITHDLKSPLRAMRGFAEIAGQVCGESEAKPFLEKISTAADRMDGLIRDALNYSQAVRQELPLEDVDTGALLRGMLDSYPDLQPHKARIVVEGRLPVVLANEAGLTQVFSNLLGNAVKFVKAGETPDIRVWAQDAPSGKRRVQSEWVRIWVEDKGIGISKEMLPRVFDMFARASKAYEGTGIGLALVRKVVQRMGGRLGVESEEGRGSRFWIELKCGKAKQSGGDAPLSPWVTEGSGTVLYVEDEASDATFMERAFVEKGLAGKLQVVGDGRSAIEYLSGTGKYGNREEYPRPTMVLLDIGLPQVSGFGVLEWIRNHPDYARLPVVMFSSSTREDDQARARELGADEFVSKPSSGLEFGKVVEGLGRWLSAGR